MLIRKAHDRHERRQGHCRLAVAEGSRGGHEVERSIEGLLARAEHGEPLLLRELGEGSERDGGDLCTEGFF